MCSEKSLVFVYCGRATGHEYLRVVRCLHRRGYQTLRRHWDGASPATEDELAAFDAADYRVLLNLGSRDLPMDKAPQCMFDRALRTGKLTIELSHTANGPKCGLLRRRVASRVRINDGLEGPLESAVDSAGWRPTQPWRVTALAGWIVDVLGKIRPLEILKYEFPTLQNPARSAEDWWTLLSAAVALHWCLRIGHWLSAIGHRLAWHARGTFGGFAAAVLTFACLEIMSIVVTQVDILFVARRGSERKGKRYRRISSERALFSALLNYATIAFWFACVYQWFPWLFAVQRDGLVLTRPLDAIYISLANMSLMGAGVEPRHPWGRAVLLIQLVLGLFMALVVVAQAVGSIQHHSMDDSD